MWTVLKLVDNEIQPIHAPSGETKEFQVAFASKDIKENE